MLRRKYWANIACEQNIGFELLAYWILCVGDKMGMKYWANCSTNIFSQIGKRISCINNFSPGSLRICGVGKCWWWKVRQFVKNCWHGKMLWDKLLVTIWEEILCWNNGELSGATNCCVRRIGEIEIVCDEILKTNCWARNELSQKNFWAIVCRK